MRTVDSALTLLLDMLFPRAGATLLYNSIALREVERLAVRSLVSLPFPCVAPLPYRDVVVRGMVRAAKYEGHERAAALLGQVLVPYVAEEVAERQVFGTFSAPVVVPVPLHKDRQRTRGYNQAERIAAALMAHTDGSRYTLLPGLLVRAKHTPPQTHMSRESRLKNMVSAFTVPTQAAVAGKDLILVDDVVTTGATLVAAREALLEAGAREVLCVAAAH
jgi:ComF family protein